MATPQSGNSDSPLTVCGNPAGIPLPVSADGGVASGATDSGNPVKIAGIYESTLPTFTNGQRGNAHIDAAGRLMMVEPDGGGDTPATAAGSGSVGSAATLFSIDTSGYNGIAVQVTSAGSSCTVAYEGSNDNSTWVSVVGALSTSTGAGPIAGSSTTAVGIYFPAALRYFRARVSVYGSGTVTAFYSLRRTSGASYSFPVGNGLPIIGNVASGAADSNGPVKIGGTFNTTAPTVSNGQRVDFQANSRGAQLAELGPYSIGRATADTQIKATAGFIHTVSIAPITATPTAGLLTIYDNTAESGTVVYSEWLPTTTIGHTITLDMPCATGIYVGFDASLANVQVTLSYR